MKKEHRTIAGDCNAHNVVWNCKDTDGNESNLYEIMEENGIYIVNKSMMTWTGDGRRKESNLDLYFTSDEIIEGIKYKQKNDSWGSDHILVMMNIEYETKKIC